MSQRRTAVFAALLAALLAAAASAQAPGPAGPEEGEDALVQLDFNDVELAVVIETIARLTGTNFIFDDRVRGRVTIVSPTRVTVDQAYAVFESVLQVKGFTTVPGPGGAIKIVPIREAKESSIETREGRATPDRDRYVTRLIPLQHIDAESISNTLKPLVSKDASLVAYPPTNMLILSDSASNIRRILSIIDSIDVETYREELAVIQVQHADAATLGDQISEIYGGEVTGVPTAPTTPRMRARAARRAPGVPGAPAERAPLRIITDTRTNSLILLAPRGLLEEIRQLVRRLDVPVTGEGSIRVYYLKHADAEELAQTLNALISGQPVARGGPPGAPPGVGAPQALRAVVSELAEAVTITADPATNSLVIQASKEAYATLVDVIERLDVQRPQVMVEALIMEVDVTDTQDLGFSGILRFINGDTDISFGSLTDPVTIGSIIAGGGGIGTAETIGPFIGRLFRDSRAVDPVTGDKVGSGNIIDGILRAAATDGGINILSAPHLLTSDNEEAEIKIGNNIPIVTSRVQSAAGQDIGLSTSQNIERRDIGVTLRVTPQISEGDTVRLKIFQELTDVDESLSAAVSGGEAAVSQTGVSLINRKIENTVVVSDGDTVVIGGLISDVYRDNLTKVPWLGDIPILGWLFKTSTRSLQKVNLLIFLTPQIMRDPDDLEYETVRKREEFRRSSDAQLQRGPGEVAVRLDEYGLPVTASTGRNPARNRLEAMEAATPLRRMLEIEQREREERERAREEAERQQRDARDYYVQAGVFTDEAEARATLTRLLDAGYEGQLLSSRSGEALLYEVRLGPYASRERAEREAGVVREAFGVRTAVTVERPEP